MKNKENLVIHALDERWTKYRLELKACQKEFSAEVVHDLRVATRRLLAVMEILGTLDPHPRVTKIRRALKEQLDSLDALRDIQVMLGKVSELAADFAELKPFQEHLLKREKKLLRRAGKEIGSLRISKLKRLIEKCHLELEETARARGWTAQLLLAVDQAYARAEEAHRIAGQLRDLARPFLFGWHTYWRADIAALLGDKDTALDLIPEAIAQGANCLPRLHLNMDFEGLRSEPRFRELLAPKG